MNILKIAKSGLLTVLAAASILSACSKDDEDFEGKDNYITSFSLKKGETVFRASITDSTITLKVPEGISLDSSEAAVVLSENARIYPDPASVIEWNGEMQFVVTSHNGKRSTYRYTIQRSGINIDKSVVLTTQAEVEAFGKLGITEISGNLVIGSTTGLDSITNLAPLYKLKKIGYALVVYPTYSAKEFVGLDNLQSVGDIIQVESVKNLEKISLPALETAGSISIKNTAIKSVEFPRLNKVSKTLKVDCPLAGAYFPYLSQVGGTITFNTASNSGAQLSRISFPVLREAGGLSFSYFSKVTKLDLPELTRTGDMYLFNLAGLYMISCPKLQTASGKITIPTISSLRELSFPALLQAGSLSIETRTINSLEFPALKTITSGLKLSLAAVDGLKGFTALTAVSGELYLGELSKMTSFKLPSSLRTIGKLTIYNRTVTAPAEISVRGLTLNELNLQAAGNIKLLGDDVFRGTLTINPTAAATFPELVGFTEIDSISFNGYISYIDDVQIKGIKKINKSFLMPNNNVKTFSMPDLEEVAGNFTINHFNQVTQSTIEIPRLRKIGGNFNVQIQSVAVSTLKFTALESVGGDLMLGTGYTGRCLSNVLFPSLESIGRKLNIYAQASPSYVSNKLADLDGFSALRNVRSVEITAQSALVSYSGLKNALASFSASNWSASKNSYNPGYADLQAGRWTKP